MSVLISHLIYKLNLSKGFVTLLIHSGGFFDAIRRYDKENQENRKSVIAYEDESKTNFHVGPVPGNRPGAFRLPAFAG